MEHDEGQVIELLKEIANLRHDIDLDRVIGLNSQEIEASSLSATFFGHVQALAHESIALRICKIYEPPSRFELNSIPGAIANLPKTLFSSTHSAALKDFATKYGVEPSEDPRETLKFRNKVAAHSEAGIKITTLPSHDAFETFYQFAYEAYSAMRQAFYGVYPALIHRKVCMGLYDLLSSGGVSDPRLFFPDD
jgi:hypothetical protein